MVVAARGRDGVLLVEERDGGFQVAAVVAKIESREGVHVLDLGKGSRGRAA